MPRKKQIDDMPVERKFGYAAALEKEQIYRELRAANPDWSFTKLFMAVSEEYIRRHQNDPTYAETSRALARREPTTRYGIENKHLTLLSNEQIAYLLDKLDGVNDPVGMSIWEWCKRAELTAIGEFK